MIKIKFITDNEIFKGEVPETWEEITVNQYIGIQTIENEAQLLGVLSGIDPGKIDNTGADLQPVFKKLSKYLTTKPDSFNNIRGHQIEVEGKNVKFPKSIDFTTFGQNSLVKTLIAKNENDLEKIVPDVFAIYLQPLVDGSFDRERVEHYKKLVLNMPIVEVRPHVVFFLKRLKRMKIDLQTV